jgi:hypothetical protein
VLVISAYLSLFSNQATERAKRTRNWVSERTQLLHE